MEYIALCASSFLKNALISERKSVTLCTGIELSIILFDHFKDTHFLRYTENSMPSFIPSYKLSCWLAKLKLLRDCIYKDISAVVFQGNDSCVEEILIAAKEIYQKHGCSKEFLYDWQLLIEEVKAYQKESPHTVHLPKLSLTETELIQEEMTRKGELYLF